MRQLEILFQFIVPLTFLAIWALTSLLNRETQPLPRRPSRPGAPGPGTTPGATPGPRPEARQAPELEQATLQKMQGVDPSYPGDNLGSETRRLAASSSLDDASSRPNGPETPRRSAIDRPAFERPAFDRTVAGSLDEPNVIVKENEVVFLDPLTGRRILSAPSSGGPGAVSRQVQRTPQNRKGNRVRRGKPDGVRQTKQEPETHRALSDQVQRSMSLMRNQPLEIKPLSTNIEALSTSMSSTATQGDYGLKRSTARPALDVETVKEMFTNHGRLREIALLSEVFLPPVSLRRGRPGR